MVPYCNNVEYLTSQYRNNRRALSRKLDKAIKNRSRQYSTIKGDLIIHMPRTLGLSMSFSRLTTPSNTRTISHFEANAIFHTHICNRPHLITHDCDPLHHLRMTVWYDILPCRHLCFIKYNKDAYSHSRSIIPRIGLSHTILATYSLNGRCKHINQHSPP